MFKRISFKDDVAAKHTAMIFMVKIRLEPEVTVSTSASQRKAQHLLASESGGNLSSKMLMAVAYLGEQSTVNL